VTSSMRQRLPQHTTHHPLYSTPFGVKRFIIPNVRHYRRAHISCVCSRLPELTAASWLTARSSKMATWSSKKVCTSLYLAVAALIIFSSFISRLELEVHSTT
jgi:hypothetical protein